MLVGRSILELGLYLAAACIVNFRPVMRLYLKKCAANLQKTNQREMDTRAECGWELSLLLFLALIGLCVTSRGFGQLHLCANSLHHETTLDRPVKETGCFTNRHILQSETKILLLRVF
jgi:hypothetical protein